MKKRYCSQLTLFSLLAVTLVTTFDGWRRLCEGAANGEITRSRQNETEKRDWLIDNSQYRANASHDRNTQELILSNGLLKRTFRLAPNAATVALDNLVTGESLLRGVKPEGIVVIDGARYEIGGLKGQPNCAFLLPEWIDTLQADPAALMFTGFEVGKPKKRFPWKRLRHHAPNAEWPPKGVYLRMDYELPEATARAISASSQPSHLDRQCLMSDDFDTLEAAWRIHTSSAHPRSSFENEGKVGEVYTPRHSCVFAERSLSAETRLVEVTIDPGTDRSASWGPGIALVWPDRVVKFNLRGGGDSQNDAANFSIWDGQTESIVAAGGQEPDLRKPWTLRLRMQKGVIYCEARTQGKSFSIYGKVPFKPSEGFPQAVRIGKMSKTGQTDDYSDPGGLVRLHLTHFATYSELEIDPLTAQKEKETSQKHITVSVHYELYDGIPCFSKWISVHNHTDKPITVNYFVSEILATVEYGSAVESRTLVQKPNIHVETDYAFKSFNHDANHHVVHWQKDPQYLTQVNYLRSTPCLLEVKPEIGPAQCVEPGRQFESFRTFVMPYDSYDRKRQAFALRRMYRTLAPWITENPLMMHARFADWERVKTAIDQCAEVGFEMVILTFGSGFNIENDSEEYVAQMKRYADYAREKGVEIGGYSLLASRRVGGGNDVVPPQGQKPTFGNSPCLGSEWGRTYFAKLYEFYKNTGFTLLEHDGSYPGDPCIETTHPGHRGYEDSRWNQFKVISDFYKWCRSHGIYLNVPDYYYLCGSNKCGMGYRETNWSLPREQQVLHTRQNIYDGTWEKLPSMGWMFVPLTQYQGGGAAATVEPLDEHLDHYERMLYSNLAMGVQACYRGPRLYDTDRTKALVKKWVDWYKNYRDILESDMVHGRRADGRDIDWMLHVNPKLTHKGMLVVFNPLKTPVQRNLQVNLYYTGLTENAMIRRQEGKSTVYRLARDYSVNLDIQMAPEEFTWYVIE